MKESARYAPFDEPLNDPSSDQLNELEKLRNQISKKQGEHKGLTLQAIHDHSPETKADLERVENELDGLVLKYQQLQSRIYAAKL